MRSQHLEIKKPCSENWSAMTPNEKGRFCDACAKTVVDFTNKSPDEIRLALLRSKGDLCGRVLPAQLQISFGNPKSSSVKLPLSGMAAGLLITSGLSSGLQAQDLPPASQVCELPNSVSDKREFAEHSKPSASTPNPVLRKTLSGKVSVKDSNTALEHVKVSLVTLSGLYSTYTNEQGVYHLYIPESLLESKNLIYFSFNEVNDENSPRHFYYYLNDFLTVKESEIESTWNFEAEIQYPIAGGIGGYSRRYTPPAIIYNGIELSEKQWAKKEVDYSRVEYLYLKKEFAEILLGRRGQYGARLYFSKDKNTFTLTEE